MKTTTALPVLDAKGYTLCPDCDSHVKCGTIGLANLEKCHCGTKVCKAAQEKLDKKVKTRKDRTILSFLKPKAATVPLTVGSQAPVHSYKSAVTDTIPAVSATLQAARSETVFSKSLAVTGPIFSFIKTLRNLVNDLPESTPEASEFDRLALFGGNPKEFDDPAL